MKEKVNSHHMMEGCGRDFSKLLIVSGGGVDSAGLLRALGVWVEFIAS